MKNSNVSSSLSHSIIFLKQMTCPNSCAKIQNSTSLNIPQDCTVEQYIVPHGHILKNVTSLPVLRSYLILSGLFTWIRPEHSILHGHVFKGELVQIFKQGDFIASFYVLYSILLHLLPLRFHCIGGFWNRTQDCCDFGMAVSDSGALTTRLYLIHGPARSHSPSARSHPNF